MAGLMLAAGPALAGGHGGGGGGGHGGGGGGHGGGGGGHAGGGAHGGGFNHGGFNHGGFNHGGYYNRGFYGFGVGLGFGYGYPWDYGYGGYGGYGGYYDPWYYGDNAAPAYAADGFAYPGAASGYANINPSLATAPGVSAPPADNVIYIRVLVPPDAEVWFEGQKTTVTGPVRFFESPPVAPGIKYAYHIRARWTQDGRVVDETREYTVYAGTKLGVDFTQRKSEKIPPPKAKPADE